MEISSRTDRLISKQSKGSFNMSRNFKKDEANIGEAGTKKKSFKGTDRGGSFRGGVRGGSFRGGDRGRVGGFRGDRERGGFRGGDKGRGGRGGFENNDLGEDAEFEKTEEELKHLEYLKKTYRQDDKQLQSDLAKERRLNQNADMKEKSLINGAQLQDERPMFSNDLNASSELPKGLDIDMLKKEIEKSRKEQEKNKLLQTFQPEQQQLQKSKCLLALQIEKVLFPTKKESSQVIIKENAHYEFDLNHDFGNHIPNLVVKRVVKGIDEEQQRKIIPGTFNQELLQNLQQTMSFFRSVGGDIRALKILKKEAEEKLKQKIILNKQEEEEDIFADAKEYIQEELPKKKIKLQDIFQQDKEKNDILPQKPLQINDDSQMEIENKQQLGNILKREELRIHREELKGSAFMQQTNDDDGYMECYPRIDMSLEAMKQGRDEFGGKSFADTFFKTYTNNRPQKPQGPKGLGRQEMNKINQIMKERQGQ